MSKKYILVATHPRSGTHFLINSINLNFKNFEFSLIRGLYPTLEGLFWTHDNEYTKEWERYLYEGSGKVKIFKTHLTPLEISLALDDGFYLNDADKKIVRTIYENSNILYVYRDGRDVLVSWFYYHKKDGGALPQGGLPRIMNASFSEFIRMPNKYFLPIRQFHERDENRAKYWSCHVSDWLAKKDVIPVAYESLKENFEQTLRDIAKKLGLEGSLLPDIKKPPFTPDSNSNISSKVLRKMKRLLVANRVAPSSYQRKGIVGDWKNYFNDSDSDFFLKYALDTMQRLNYKI